MTVQSGMHSNSLRAPLLDFASTSDDFNVRVAGGNQDRRHLLECGSALFSRLLLPVLEDGRTLTVKHSSIRWMFCMLFISKHGCILIHCGINKSVGRKIKMNTAH